MLIITEAGEVVEFGDWDIRNLYPRLSDSEFIVYAVRNCGVIAVEQSEGGVRVRWRLEGIASATVVGLVQWLYDQPEQRVVISRLSLAWSHVVLPTCMAAVNHVLETITDARKLNQRFFRHIRTFSHETRPRFIATLDYFRERKWLMENQAIEQLDHKYFNGRFILLRNEASRLIVQTVGSGFLTIDKKWPELGDEIEVEDQIDLDFGRWIAQAYRQASRQGEPIFDDVDAEVETRPGVYRRLQYTRLIVPTTDRAGTQFLLCTSEPDGNIDLAGRG